ncbi:CLUMA_CG006028, isoform A, partial [Clunio marinus]
MNQFGYNFNFIIQSSMNIAELKFKHQRVRNDFGYPCMTAKEEKKTFYGELKHEKAKK